MHIRPADTEDMEALLGLYQILFSEMTALQPEYFKPAFQSRAFLDAIIKNPDADILSAFDDCCNLCGFALVQQLISPACGCFVPHTYAYLIDMAVLPEHRGNKIGSALLRAVKDWGKERNLHYVELNVLSNNLPAVSLYRHHDFCEYIKTMRCPL